MSQHDLGQCVINALEQYFRDLDGERPSAIYDMVLKSVEKTDARSGARQSRHQSDAGGGDARHQPQHPAQETHRTPVALRIGDPETGIEDPDMRCEQALELPGNSILNPDSSILIPNHSILI